jgi:hypothetical protein
MVRRSGFTQEHKGGIILPQVLYSIADLFSLNVLLIELKILTVLFADWYMVSGSHIWELKSIPLIDLLTT